MSAKGQNLPCPTWHRYLASVCLDDRRVFIGAANDFIRRSDLKLALTMHLHRFNNVRLPLRVVGWLGLAAMVCLLFLVLVLSHTPASAAGLRLAQVPASGKYPAIDVAIWYPSDGATHALTFETTVGPFTIEAAKDAAVRGLRLPLIVISHGQGGSFVVHHDTAEQLADAGFVVAAINHPGDTSLDKSRTDDISVFFERSLDVKRVIDFMTGASSLASVIDANRIGFYGLSRGGYTGLVAIGAELDSARFLDFCGDWASHLCDQVRSGRYSNETVVHDPRIKAAAISDPLAAVLAPQSIGKIKVPVQLWASELGGSGVDPKSLAELDAELKTPHTFDAVANSHHFSFIAVCPPDIAKLAPQVCNDAPGFDRAAFHERLNHRLIDFFRAYL